MRELNQRALQCDDAAEQRDLNSVHRDEDAHQRDLKSPFPAGNSDSIDVLALTRSEAAADRLYSSQDRRAAAAERSQAGLDRGIALADRLAGASGREDSELDRDAATDDRAASASYRQYATELAQSLDFGWTVRQLTPPKILFFSPGCRKILGLSPDGPKPTLSELRAMVIPDDVVRTTAELWEPASHGQFAKVELRIRRADGAVRWLRVVSSPTMAEDGTVTRAADIVEDITDAKSADAARSAQRTAEYANTAKSAFLSRISHELRTPLNAVLGFGQLLERDNLSEIQADSVDHIMRGGRHLLELINDVLDTSMIATEQLKVPLGPVDIANLLTETISLTRPLAAASGINIALDRQSPPGQLVYANTGRLRQVLLNLLSNAIKYNRPNGTIYISCEVLAHSTLQVTVTDTGLGIDPELLPRLFDPFDRLDRDSSDIQGTGLGLALSQQLMTLMGGQIHATSQVGRGTSFSLTLPLSEPLLA